MSNDEVIVTGILCVCMSGMSPHPPPPPYPLLSFPFFSPDIQVGMPLSSLVDKVLESKAKELLPNISEVVDKLRESKTRGSPSTPDPSLSFGHSSGQTTEKSTLEAVSKPKPTDFASLPLPIDIPGLISSTSGSSASPSSKKETNDGKASLKSKSKASDINAKENKTKGKSGQPKVPTTAKESLKREKEGISEKDTTAEEGGKEKDKHKPTTKLKKTKDEVKDKGTGVHKEKPQDGKVGATEKPDNVKDKGASVRKDKTIITEKLDDVKDKGTSLHRDKSHDGKPGSSTEKPDQELRTDSKVGRGIPANDGKRDTATELAESEVQSDSKKVLPPRRRSARIASLSESVEDAGNEEGDSDDQNARDKPCEGEAVDNKNMTEETVKAKSSSSSAKRKRKQKSLKSESQKKKQRLLSSSTDEELEIQVSSEEETEDNGKCTSKSKFKQQDNQIHCQDARALKRAKKRALQQLAEDPIPQKKSRRLSKNFNDVPTTETKPPGDHAPPQVENVQKHHRRKSSQPQRLPVRSSKSPPVVVTRYNRQIKPNRRYLDTSGEASEAGSEGEDEEGGEKHSPQDSEEAYSNINSSEHEESDHES